MGRGGRRKARKPGAGATVARRSEEVRTRLALGMAPGWGWPEAHRALQRIADAAGEYAGIPQPVAGFAIDTEDRYRNREVADRVFDRRAELGGDHEGFLTFHEVRDDDRVRNRWYSRAKGCWVYLLERDGRVVHATAPRQPAADRLTFWLATMGASQGWDADCELRAQEKLRELIKPHLFDMYQLTGTFLETSPRSRVTYLLRRGRPTLALVPTVRGEEDTGMRCLAALCMHPLALYRGTWAGCMVPTDDVIAHLLYLRGDEAGFWRRANQHDIDDPAAGV